jgi:hypothetical protein
LTWLGCVCGASRIAGWLNALVEEWQQAQAFAVTTYSGTGPIHRRIHLTVQDGDTARAPATITLGVLSERPEFVLYREDEGLEYRFTEDTGRRLLNLHR